MSVRRAQRHILSDLKLELIIYRIFLLSPFEITQNHQLAKTWRTKLYMCSMLLVYAALRISFSLQFPGNNGTLQYFSTNGRMIMFVDLFDFTFSSVSFVATILNGLITSSQQIEFFEELHYFDKMLFTAFGIPTRRSRSRTAHSCTLFLGLVYLLGYFVSSLRNIFNTMLTPYQCLAYYFTFYLDAIVSLLTALYYVNCTQLCRERLAIIRIVLRNYRNLSTEQMDTVLEQYNRIRRQILLINRFMGFVLLLKIAHDFTLGSSIVYVMCSSLYRAENIFEIIFWFVGTVIGTLLMIMGAEMLMTEVIVKMRNNLMPLIITRLVLR